MATKTYRIYDDAGHRAQFGVFKAASAVSFALILCLAGLSMYLILQRYILSNAEVESVHLGRMMLMMEEEAILSSGSDGAQTIEIDRSELARLDKRIREHLDPFNVVKIKVYNLDRQIVYSNDSSLIGQFDRDNEELPRVFDGQILSAYETEDEVWDMRGEQRFDVDIVETYLPIRDKDNQVVGSFEIYLDASKYQQDIWSLFQLSMIAMFAVLTIVFGTLLALMRRATRVIYSKNEDIKVLSGLLPICAACKKIKNEQGEWEVMETYIATRSESDFTHGICPECFEVHYPDLT